MHPRHVHAALTPVAILTLLLGVGCGSETPVGPTTGSIRITTQTTGTELDANGYTAAVDGGTGQAVGVNATLTVPDLATGSHSVTLSGLAANCTVSGSNPVTVTVSAGATAQATFNVTCTSTTGSIQVTAASSGANIPTSYSVSVDGGNAQTIAANGSFTFPSLAVGDHTVELSGVAANCAVAAPNPRTVTVASGTTPQTAQTTFTVTCTSTTGSIEVTTASSGANIPLTYDLTIDGTSVGTIGPSQTFTYGPYPVGDHTVELTVAANCTVTAPNPRTITIPTGATQQTVATTFTVTCIATEGFIEVTTASSGVNVPFAYDLTIDGSPVGTIGPSQTFTYGPYAVGDHTVELTVAANCTVTAPNPRTVTIPTGATQQTVATTFVIGCT